MFKAIAVIGLVWGVYSGVSGVSHLRDGVHNIASARAAAIEQASNY